MRMPLDAVKNHPWIIRNMAPEGASAAAPAAAAPASGRA